MGNVQPHQLDINSDIPVSDVISDSDVTRRGGCSLDTLCKSR